MERGARFPPGTWVTHVPFGRQGSCELKLPEHEQSSAKCRLSMSWGSFSWGVGVARESPGQRGGGCAPGVVQDHLQCGLSRVLPSQGCNRSGAVLALQHRSDALREAASSLFCV